MTMKTEYEKQRAGEWFDATSDELSGYYVRIQRLLKEYNATGVSEKERRAELMNQMFGAVGTGVTVVPPVYCDYGCHVFLGDGVYLNTGAVFLDAGFVRVGEHTLIGPNAQFYTVSHPVDAKQRRTGVEKAKPITIGKDVWIGGSVVILQGVTIGDNSVVGAGSVVTKDIPANVIAAGNPCKVIKKIEN